MYTDRENFRAIALYPEKIRVNNLIRKLKRILDKSLNLDAYNLIAVLNSYLKSWSYYFNLGNCTHYRNIIKNVVYKMIWRWAHKKHKKWGKKKIAEFYFLIKQTETNSQKNTKHFETRIHKKKQKFQKTKNIKWSFHGKVDSKITNKNKSIHLFNISKKGSTVSALVFRIPQNLKKVHAYHTNIYKLIKWVEKTNQKTLGSFSD